MSAEEAIFYQRNVRFTQNWSNDTRVPPQSARSALSDTQYRTLTARSRFGQARIPADEGTGVEITNVGQVYGTRTCCLESKSL